MKKRLFLIASLVLTLLTAWSNEKKIAYILPLNDDVDNAMWAYTRRACDEAVSMNADLLLVHINTYGGELMAADSIRTALLRMPMPTIAYVDPNAASAGAIITLACDSVYMAPGACYGASTVVDNAGTPLPDKYQSYAKTIIRSTAESKGKIYDTDSTWHWRRNPQVAERFVTVDSVLAFTPEEAMQANFAEGIVKTIDEILEKNLAAEYQKIEFRPTTSDRLLGFFANPIVRALLIMLIIGGIYLEMHTPGLGFAGCVAFIAAVLFFLPMALSGTIAPWVIITFVIGIILLGLELFVIPGFGICGVLGIVAILFSLVGGMFDPDSINDPYASDIITAIAITAIGLVLAVAVVWYLTSKHGPIRIRRVSELMTELKDSDGYVGVDTSLAKYVGIEGETLTDMRPAGKITIDDKEFDAVSVMGFIDANRIVKVIKFENAQLYVKEI